MSEQERIDALAAALLSEFERMPVEFGAAIAEIAEECATAILDSLDGWTLVRDSGDVTARGIELARQQAAKIARLREALESIAISAEYADLRWVVRDARAALAACLPPKGTP